MYPFLTVRGLLNDLFCRLSGAKFSAHQSSDEQNIQVRIGKRSDPYAFFGVRNNAMTIYADVRESISNKKSVP